MCYFQAGHARRDLAEELRIANNPKNEGPAGIPSWLYAEAIEITRRAGVISQEEFYTLLHDYLQLPIEKALGARDPLTRALATLDSRVGKRRLRRLSEQPDDHPLVRLSLALRCDAEGIGSPKNAA